MNIHKIKFVGTSEIESSLDIKKDYSMVLKRVGVKRIIKTDTGEEDNIYTYVLESLDVITIIEEGKTIKGEPKSMSKKLRGAIFYKGEELGVEDSEAFYQKVINHLIINIDDIVGKMLDK